MSERPSKPNVLRTGIIYSVLFLAVGPLLLIANVVRGVPIAARSALGWASTAVGLIALALVAGFASAGANWFCDYYLPSRAKSGDRGLPTLISAAGWIMVAGALFVLFLNMSRR